MSAAGERQKRWRALQRSGEVVVPVTVSDKIVEGLIDRGWLAIGRSENRKAIGSAIRRAIEDDNLRSQKNRNASTAQREAAE